LIAVSVLRWYCDDGVGDGVFGAGTAALLAAYSVDGVIGSGGYGTVYSATRRSDQLTVNTTPPPPPPPSLF